MFDKYFEFIKNLFEGVFTSGRDSVSFVDYIYVILFTLGLIASVIAIGIVLFYSAKLPVILYKKFVKKLQTEITETEEKIEKMAECTTPTEENLAEKLDNLCSKLFNRMVLYVLGVVVIYIPLLVPTLLFIFSFIKSLF